MNWNMTEDLTHEKLKESIRMVLLAKLAIHSE